MLNELPDITTPLFTHLFRAFTVRELVQLKCVCKAWKDSVSQNAMIVAAAQREDETKDWYFPLRFERHFLESGLQVSQGRSWKPWTWWGIHHPSEEIHRLPPLPCFKWDAPQYCQLHIPSSLDRESLHELHQGCLLASVGGLLLITDIVWSSMMLTGKRWRRPLVVYNPLTERWRMLPALHCHEDVLANLSVKRDNAHVHLMVNENANANAYTVLLTSKCYVCVYSSTANSWKVRVFSEAIPFGPVLRPTVPIGFTLLYRLTVSITTNFCNVPSVFLGGKVYYVELEVDGSSMAVFITRNPDIDIRSRGYVRMFEIDEEAGTWKPPVRYALRTYFSEGDGEFGLGISSFWMKIVECRAGTYAILPATLDIEMPMNDAATGEDDAIPAGASGETYRAYGYVPMQFYVLQLHGSGLALGRVLTQLPSTLGRDEVKLRQLEWLHVFDHNTIFYSGPRFIHPNHNESRGGSWYDCSARGRVIRMIWSDYLVRYDVVSGKSTTRLLPDRRFGRGLEGKPAFEYRPTFHMKP